MAEGLQHRHPRLFQTNVANADQQGACRRVDVCPDDGGKPAFDARCGSGGAPRMTNWPICAMPDGAPLFGHLEMQCYPNVVTHMAGPGW